MERRKSRRISTLSESNPATKTLKTLQQVPDTDGVSAQLGLICDGIKQIIETLKVAQQNDKVWGPLKGTLEEHLGTFDDLAKQQPVSTSASASLQTYSKKLQEVVYALILEDDNPWSGHSSLRERIGTFAKKVVGREKVAKRVAECSTGITEAYEGVKRSFSTSTAEQATAVEGDRHHHRSQDEIISAIERWASSPDITSNIFCLSDRPGTGKSAIAKEMAHRWKEQGVLAGYFSFTPENSSGGDFCTHLAKDIASNIVDLKPKIEAALADDTSGAQPLQQRWNKAIVEPLQSLDKDTFFVIDALDACSATDIKELLQLILSAGPEISSEHSVRFLITTQPVDDIVSVLRGNFSVTLTSFAVGSGTV
ncbi:hypothetical protein FRC17_000301 [Serendipita sp. 399]|nr:hypothetical protein FRC17_000301 [Serendipita sp. 399]